ncbi:MAG: ribonuclease III domain-containing protein [Clostridia bacterium]
MNNYLNPKLSKQEMHNMSSLALAHIGDSVFEILTRAYLATNGVCTSKNLHRETVLMVKATTQACFADTILDMLTDEEHAVYKRGRNTSPRSIPKSATREDYAKATALEALFGYLYLNQKYDRINELFDKIIKKYEKEEENV